MMQVEFTPLEIDEDSLAFGAHEEVGHGGHFLGAAHTMDRFRDCFYRPMLSSSKTSSAGSGTAVSTRPTGPPSCAQRRSIPTSNRRWTRPSVSSWRST